MRRLLVTVSTVAVLSASAGSARAGGPAFVVVQPSLNATIAREIDADRHALAQAQQRQRALGMQLRNARAKLASATDPFSYEDGVASCRSQQGLRLHASSP